MTRSFSGLTALLVLLVFNPTWVWAEHTPEHRFTISGYVYDDAGKPLSGAVVIRDRGGQILGTIDVGVTGYYQVHLHLHNSDLGEKLLVHSEAGEKELIVKFDPNDKTTERQAEVNFGVVPSSSSIWQNGYVMATVGAGLVGGIYLVIRRRNHRQKGIAKKRRRQKQMH